jgi:hypothetical protein
MKKATLVCLLVGVCFCALASLAADDFVVCQSTYALCTGAKCAPVPGKKDTVSCSCDVKSGYSVGQQPCQEVKQTGEGQQIKSRYFPIKSYQACSNSRPWAWCLDKECVVDKKDPSKAECACTLVKDQGTWVIVTDTYHKSACTTGIVSSATVTQDHEITDFLKDNDLLKPFPVTVLNGEK